MYLEHYHLKLKPFQITADPKFLWMGEKHKEALATLRYGILDNRGFLLLTGEVGTGKTVLINRLVTMLDIDTAVATLADPDLESMDFYNMLANGLKMNRTFASKGAFLIQLRDFLHQSYAKRKQVLLIIDESQRLNHRLMEDIRVLSNIELHDRKLINIFFVGQQEFNSILMAPQNRALAQRITVRYNIEPLDQTETGLYINHRIKIAGGDYKIYNKKAVDEIFQFSTGLPRLINIICDHALLTGYARGVKSIDENIIKECAEELRIPIPDKLSVLPVSSSISISSAVDVQDPSGELDSHSTKKSNEKDKPSEDLSNGILPRSGRSMAWKLTYAGMVFLLLAIVAFAIDYFTGSDKPRWGADELTPQKYKTSLEKEKELLFNRLQGAGEQPDTTVSVSNTDLKTAPSTNGHTPLLNPADSAADENTQMGATPPSDGFIAHSNNALSAVSPGGGEIEPLPLIKDKIIINFHINSNEIDNQSYTVLDSVAAYMVQHPDEIIHVRGFTDTSGTESYNESVSRFRASAVKSYLIGKGVLADNIIVFAMGSVEPIASNESVDGRRKNRRVEIEFIKSMHD